MDMTTHEVPGAERPMQLPADLQETGTEVEPYVLVGHSGERLVWAGQTAFAVVVGKTGHSSFPHVAFGSTGRTVATHSKTPVMVVP